ncbi:hypothetical protein N7449_005886 [Penicillium cf. viridicatum]|uniref:Uncharacterized protein n=1 Tax=Penicillium cf. viridicatum TaxID=2972119 RepID=A0A9W9MGV8_9EURO|nr:hypothetical protein N7449_005886 [Penicillium cf. viridicatum]
MTSKVKNRVKVVKIDVATARTAASSKPRTIPVTQSAEAAVTFSLPSLAVQTIVANFPAVAVATRNQAHLLEVSRSSVKIDCQCFMYDHNIICAIATNKLFN